MEHTIPELAARMDALDLWKRIRAAHWAVKPRGTVFPYFVAVVFGDQRPVKVRLLLLEGWKTFHDYLITLRDRNFGYYTTPMEMAHLELVILADGSAKLFRHDPGYLPQPATEAEQALGIKLLWEVYGVLLRLESDESLPMRYAGENCIFARLEGADGIWTDVPLAIPECPAYVENIALPMELVRKAKDLPMDAAFRLQLDFRLLPQLMTKEARPRCCYALIGVDAASGERVLSVRTSMGPEGGLKAMWEAMPRRFLEEVVRYGRVPGEVMLGSGRMFRFLRGLCVELPIRLSLHDRLERLEAVFEEER